MKINISNIIFNIDSILKILKFKIFNIDSILKILKFCFWYSKIPNQYFQYWMNIVNIKQYWFNIGYFKISNIESILKILKFLILNEYCSILSILIQYWKFCFFSGMSAARHCNCNAIALGNLSCICSWASRGVSIVTRLPLGTATYNSFGNERRAALQF